MNPGSSQEHVLTSGSPRRWLQRSSVDAEARMISRFITLSFLWFGLVASKHFILRLTCGMDGPKNGYHGAFSSYWFGAGGCLGNSPRATKGGGNGTEELRSQREKFVTCEGHYLRTAVIGSDERVDGALNPTVVELDERDTGIYAEVRTSFGTVRSSEGAPNGYVDYEVMAHYDHGDEEIFRTRDADRDQTDGSQIYCK